MARFDRQIAMAKRLIQKNGQLVQWKSNPKEVPANPAAPWNGGTVTAETRDVWICFVPDTDRDTRKFIAAVTGREIPIGNLAGLMGEVPFDPTNNDIVVRDGVSLSVVSVGLLSPNGQRILYVLEFVG